MPGVAAATPATWRARRSPLSAGDYYLTPDGELAEAPGQLALGPGDAGSSRVDPAAPVDGADFIALMEGRHPGTGAWLRRAGADGSRGGGIDVTFSAPKSVSVVWALGDPWQREQIEAAHARAVERSVGYLRSGCRSFAAAMAPRSSRSPPRI